MSTAPFLNQLTNDAMAKVITDYRDYLAKLTPGDHFDHDLARNESHWAWRYLGDLLAIANRNIANSAQPADLPDVIVAIRLTSAAYFDARDMVTALATTWCAGEPLPETAEQVREILRPRRAAEEVIKP